ncbi:protein kinase [Rhodococcus koreensis]|uniref:protein kinase domain-containing protein n=1 Tax=Rhodococcus koreensis TaxID=99653 RepID=UPI00366AD006
MIEDEPRDTQRYAFSSVAAELQAVGFDDVAEIGHGGFGVVYRCTQPDLDRIVAVKVLITDLDEESRNRFFREQRAMGRLSGHPNIVNVLQVGVTETGRPYLAMQYQSHGSLDARIRVTGPLRLDQVLRLGVKIAGAAETAHRTGILHRDVKPANILLTDYGEPALTDFGIAHISGGFETDTGVVTGSPAFTAPEVLRGDSPSPASDVYGLGATLFSALTGHAAFERRSGEQVVAQFLRITTQPVPDLREHGIDDDVSGAIEHAMAADPRDRPSAAEFGDELRRIQYHHGFPVDEMALDSESQPGHVPDPTSHPAGTPPDSGNSSLPTYFRVSKAGLPEELTSFVGRRTELGEAKKLLAVSHLVTLTGIGGVGKTRLALRVADNVKRAFADGVYLIELDALSNGMLLMDTVAGALGVRAQSTRSLFNALVEYLATRQILLVLDNCEHLVDVVAELTQALLLACPGLRVLATSREPLGISGERVLRVPPLTVPAPEHQPSLQGLPRYDAVTLFTDRAAAVVPTFALTDHNKGAISQICSRLEGLPLPIELAAARLPAMSPEQILQRLTDRYTLLTRGARTAPTRQQTLRLCIDWSYELCTPEEQLVWARISVFAGSAELEAAEFVCGDDLAPEALLEVIASLVGKSILIREELHTIVRFRLLDTLRDYGCEKLQRSGEHLRVRRRHRDWYQRLVLDAEADWITSRQIDWLGRLEREQPNLREVLEFCVFESPDTGLRIAAALYPFWSARGLFSEGRHWLDQLLAKCSGESPIEEAKALYADSALAEIQGDLEAEAALVERARAVAVNAAAPEAHALLARAEGFLALTTGDAAQACAHFERALDLVGLNDDVRSISTLLLLGLAYDRRGDPDLAIECYEQALAITEPRGESIYRSYALRSNAIARWRKKDHGSALRLLGQALPLTRRVGDPRTAASCLEVLAWIAAASGHEHRATVMMGAADELVRSIGSFTVWFPDLLDDHENCVRTTRRILGDRRFDQAWREGRLLDLDAAITYGLNEPPVTRSPGRTSASPTTLTKREMQVAELIAEGLTNKAIAARLVIAPRTAQGHVEHVLVKLGFTSRAQVAAWIADRRSHKDGGKRLGR